MVATGEESVRDVHAAVALCCAAEVDTGLKELGSSVTVVLSILEWGIVHLSPSSVQLATCTM